MATTFDPGAKGSNVALSGGNLTATGSGAGSVGATHTFSGKTYFEVTPTNTTGTPAIGIASRVFGFSSAVNLGTSTTSVAFLANGQVLYNNAALTTIQTYAGTNVIGVAFDPIGKLIWFRTGPGSWNNSGTADPASGAGGIDLSSTAFAGGTIVPAVGFSATGTAMTAAFATFANTAPTGFLSIDTQQFAATASLNGTRERMRSSTPPAFRTVAWISNIPAGGGGGGGVSNYGFVN